MKVILTTNIKKLGKIGELLKVSNSIMSMSGTYVVGNMLAGAAKSVGKSYLKSATGGLF